MKAALKVTLPLGVLSAVVGLLSGGCIKLVDTQYVASGVEDPNAGMYVYVRAEGEEIIAPDGERYRLAGVSTEGFTDVQKAAFASQLRLDLTERNVLLTRHEDRKVSISIPMAIPPFPGPRWNSPIPLITIFTIKRKVPTRVVPWDYGGMLVWQGMAKAAPGELADAEIRRAYAESEENARQLRRGLWGEKGVTPSKIMPQFPPHGLDEMLKTIDQEK